MNSDEQGKDVKALVAAETKAVMVEVYKDAAKPAVIRIGHTVEQAVEVALAIPNMLLSGAKAGLDKLAAALKKKLSGVPADRLLLPPANIAAPAALQYVLLGEGVEAGVLREMFEDLLVASMDQETAERAHPAFVSIVGQLTSDEAWLLKSIDRDRYPYVERNGRSGIITPLGTGIGIQERNISSYVTNLVRLGILAWHDGMTDSFHGGPPELVRLVEKEFPHGVLASELRGGALFWMSVTPFGRQFLDTCVRAPGRP